ARQRAERGVADRGRLRAHLELRRSRAWLHRGAEDARDLRAAGNQVDGPLHRRPDRGRPARDPGQLSGLVHRDQAERRGDGPGVRPSGGGEVRDASPVPGRGLGDLLDARSAGSPVQARPADDTRAVRGVARPHRGRHRPRLRRGQGRSQGAPARRYREQAVSGRAGQRAPGGRSRHTGAGGAAARTKPTSIPSPTAASPPLVSEGAAVSYHARQMLARAHWAAGAFATFDRDTVLRIAEAVAKAAHAESARYADWAVKETGFGVVEHKVIKNEACSLGLFERYKNEDFVSPRIDQVAKIISIPRPAGVILALTPSTNPVCSVFFKVILALLTRNAIVVSPHPMARACCTDAASLL